MTPIRILLVAAILGCGGDTGTQDAAPTELELIGRDWSIPPGEYYKCIGIRVERDMHISQFRTMNPLGEHHTVLTVTDQLGGFGGTQLGEYDCDVLTVDLEMLFASGVGTDPLTLPEGVALEVRAGQYLHLNLHLYNTTDSMLTTRSAVIANLVEPVPLDRQAEMVFTGTFAIDVPPAATRTLGGGCTFTRDATLFAYWPHMHQYGTHHKVTFTVGGAPMVLHDQPFDFQEQRNYPFAPMLQVHAGDSVQIECTYTNTSAVTLQWGDSSTEEMCFTGLYRYPKQATTLFDCTEGQP